MPSNLKIINNIDFGTKRRDHKCTQHLENHVDTIIPDSKNIALIERIAIEPILVITLMDKVFPI